MLNQKVGTNIAIVAVLAFGIGASYIIISFASGTDFSLATPIEAIAEAEQ